MRMMEYGWIDEMVRQAKEVASDLQPWPDYFDFKAKELKTVLGFYEFTSVDSILEIGCGNGFTTCLLSKKARHVKAFDLPVKDSSSHSVGIGMAESLVRRMDIRNMDVVGGSVADMPFKDGSFDIVFSQYMLQYVRDKRKALQEMRRVLADNGVVITIVPNFTERIFVPLIRCQYILKRLLVHAMNKDAKGAVVSSRSTLNIPGAHTPDKISRAIDDYLFLRPDGAYKSYIEELMNHRPGAWKKLLADNGLRVTGTFSTQMLPMGLFELLGSPATKFISKKINSLTRRIGGLPIVKNMGYSVGFIAVKN